MDTAVKRRALSLLNGGVYVLTARDGARFAAATVAWAMQTSFAPLLFTVALGRGSNAFRCLERSGSAVLHVAGHRQQKLARRFACPTESRNGPLDGEPFVGGASSAPVLPAFPAHFDCRVDQITDTSGDHALVVLCAIAVQCPANFRPLTLAALRSYLERSPLPPRRIVSAARPAAQPAALAAAEPMDAGAAARRSWPPSRDPASNRS